MLVKIILQLIGITTILTSMCFIAFKFKGMGSEGVKYTFYYIFIRWLWGDKKPIRWLKNNLRFLAYLIFEIGQFFILIGLLHQLFYIGLDNKLEEFVYGGPISSIGGLWIMVELFKRAEEGPSLAQKFNNSFKLNKNNKLK